jgi:hypothetical protein
LKDANDILHIITRILITVKQNMNWTLNRFHSFTIHHSPFTIYHSFAIHHLPFFCHLPFTIYHLPFFCHLPFTIYHSLWIT